MLMILSAATVEVTHDIALILVGSGVFHLHDRLKRDCVGLFKAVFTGEDRRHLESEFVGVHVVVTSVDDVDFDIDDW